jgi:hypothetical protein
VKSRGQELAQRTTGGIMRKTRLWITMGCCLVAASALSHAQSMQKAGLWESTTTTSFGGSQMPQMPGGGGMMGAPRTMQVCVTQAMIDKYGAPFSKPQRGDCTVSSISLKPDGMTANVSCTGQMTATGTVQTTFPAPGTAETKMHLTGTMQMGPNTRPMEVNVQTKSVYKGPDCGSVQPMQVPADK